MFYLSHPVLPSGGEDCEGKVRVILCGYIWRLIESVRARRGIASGGGGQAFPILSATKHQARGMNRITGPSSSDERPRNK